MSNATRGPRGRAAYDPQANARPGAPMEAPDDERQAAGEPGERRDVPVRQLAMARYMIVVLREDGTVDLADPELGNWRIRVPSFDGIVRVAAGYSHFLGLRSDGRVVVGGEGSDARRAERLRWQGAAAVSACEGHSAMLTRDGRAVCVDGQAALDPPGQYADAVAAWEDVAQLALTYGEPYARTLGGRFLCRDKALEAFFNDRKKPRISQIAAFQCYYAPPVVAALYLDGTVKAVCDGREIEQVRRWKRVRKVCCGNHAAVVALTDKGRVLCPDYLHYVDGAGREPACLKDVADLDVNFMRLVCLRRDGGLLSLAEE